MKEVIAQLKRGFESSSGMTPEFKSFARVFKNEFTRGLALAGCTDVDIRTGHFELSGFFRTGGTGQVYYFSTGDVRGGYPMSMMYRTAKDYSDYSGGSNRWIEFSENMVKQMQICD